MKKEFFEKLRKIAKKHSKQGDSHGFDHVMRVYNMAVRIGIKEKADLDVIRTAALLHDIAREKQRKTHKCHAEEGAKMAKKILEKTNFPKEKIVNVIHSIKVHRFTSKLKVKTKEAQILKEADRLELLGAIGIIRTSEFGFSRKREFYNLKDPEGKEKETTISAITTRCLSIKPNTFKTKLAKKIAKKRYKFMEEFVKQIKNEWKGKK
jgi:uncharacterized protein